MSGLILFYVITGLITPCVVSKHVQFYRKDYTYIEEYDAFYKVHWEINPLGWRGAFNACYEEGAKLFYPSGEEWTIVKNLTEAMSIPPNETEIYVGFHDEFNLGQFITVDGKPTDSPLNADDDITAINRCMLMDFVTGLFRVCDCDKEPNTAITPFVCKKVDEESCPTVDHEYKYMKKTKKCYKINNIPKNWQSAMKTCFMEGGILTLIDNKADLPDLALNEGQSYFVGFRRMFSSLDFYNVRGKKVEYSNFRNQYGEDEYRNFDCGVMRYYSSRDDLMEAKDCNDRLPFICEMAVE